MQHSSAATQSGRGSLMSIWGKLAAAELLVAGPIAALLGGRAAPDDRAKKQDQLEENQVAFTVGVIALGAKMANGRRRGHQRRSQRLQECVQGFQGGDEAGCAPCSISPSRMWRVTRLAPSNLSSCSKAIASCSRTCSRACSISPRPTRPCTPRRNSSSRRSPNVSVLATPTSGPSGPATSPPPSAIELKAIATI